MNRRELIQRVSERIGRRQLVYVGTRGDDAEAIGDIPQLSGVFSLIASLQMRSAIRTLALEELTGERMDLDTSDIDTQLDDPTVVHFRRAVMQALSGDSVVVTYRPTAFLSGICFSAGGRCHYAGMFHAQQQAFEHKPWVETSLRGMGVETIPWIYVADEHQLEVLEILADGPVVLRRSRSSGGTGIVRVERATALEVPWAIDADGFLSAAPYIEGIPANVSGVVWHDGVTVHCPSVQIVGAELLTTREFGYCGNDFDAAVDLDTKAVDELEAMTVKVGEWLRTQGFVGAFGIDVIVTGSQVRFVELNPRLQGVTHLACQWAAATERSCVLLEHVAASLGLDAPTLEPLSAQLREMAGLSHIVLHKFAATPSLPVDEVARRLAGHPDVRRLDVLPRPGVRLAEGAPLARATLGVRATDDGTSLTPGVQALVREVLLP